MITRKLKLFYGIGGLGKNMVFALSTVMFIYLTDYLGVSPLFVGGLFLIVRIWDAINDLIMGNIVDNTKSRWGKFRPWILIGTVLNSIVLILFFLNPNLPANSLSLMIYISVMYLLWGMTYTLMDIPFWALLPALSKKQKEREEVTVFVRLFSNIGIFLIAAPYVMIVKFLGGGDSQAEKLEGFFLLACIVSVIFLISQILVVKFVKEKKELPSSKTSLKKALNILVKNDQLLVIVVVIIMFQLVLYITSGMAFFFLKYDLGNENLMVAFGGGGGVLVFLSALLFPWLSKRFNRKQIFQISVILPIVGYLGLVFTTFFLNNDYIGLIFFGTLVFLGIGFSMIIQTLLLSDSVEYGEWKLGERTEGIIFSVQTFMVKFSYAVSSGLIGVGLALLNFKENQVQTASTIYGMRVMMFVIPVIGLIIALRIYNKHFNLDEKTYKNIINDLEERKKTKGE